MTKKNEIKKLEIDYTPLEEFRYNQISNHKFEFMLVNHDMKVVHSPFECKDYLQDIFWCEANSKSSSVYGLSWKPGMFDITTDRFYMALSGGKITLNDRIEPLRKFLNAFEEKQGIQPTVIYATDDPKIIVVEFSKDWTFCGQMLSAYTTLIRAAGAYQEGDVMEYLVKLYHKEVPYPDYVEVERRRLSSNLVRLAGLYEGKKPLNHTWKETGTIGESHDAGITNCPDFPTGNVPLYKGEPVEVESDDYDEDNDYEGDD